MPELGRLLTQAASARHLRLTAAANFRLILLRSLIALRWFIVQNSAAECSKRG
jgi:hypothetical protein